MQTSVIIYNYKSETVVLFGDHRISESCYMGLIIVFPQASLHVTDTQLNIPSHTKSVEIKHISVGMRNHITLYTYKSFSVEQNLKSACYGHRLLQRMRYLMFLLRLNNFLKVFKFLIKQGYFDAPPSVIAKCSETVKQTCKHL